MAAVDGGERRGVVIADDAIANAAAGDRDMAVSGVHGDRHVDHVDHVGWLWLRVSITDLTCRRRSSRGCHLFYIVVPTTKVKNELETWWGGFGVYQGVHPDQIHAFRERSARDHEAAVAEARRRARQRLHQMIATIKTAGGHADGEVGVEDPVEATKAVLKRQAAFDEITVSTLPAGLSRWAKKDVPRRIAHLTHVPVTTVEAKARAKVRPAWSSGVYLTTRSQARVRAAPSQRVGQIPRAMATENRRAGSGELLDRRVDPP